MKSVYSACKLLNELIEGPACSVGRAVVTGAVVLNVLYSCPGSVLFLFKKKSPTDDVQFEYSLHTGDFRAEREMLAYPQLQSLCMSQLYLDTTYVSVIMCVCTSCCRLF